MKKCLDISKKMENLCLQKFSNIYNLNSNLSKNKRIKWTYNKMISDPHKQTGEKYIR